MPRTEVVREKAPSIWWLPECDCASCRLSALGDTMHIQKSQGIVFMTTRSSFPAWERSFWRSSARTQSSRETSSMHECSRVITSRSPAKMSQSQATLFNGGRGSWINQPRNFTLADNIFINNTTKCQHDPRRGRRSFLTVATSSMPKLYFTTYEPGGRYGHVTVRGNTFISGTTPRMPSRLLPAVTRFWWRTISSRSDSRHCASHWM